MTAHPLQRKVKSSMEACGEQIADAAFRMLSSLDPHAYTDEAWEAAVAEIIDGFGDKLAAMIVETILENIPDAPPGYLKELTDMAEAAYQARLDALTSASGHEGGHA